MFFIFGLLSIKYEKLIQFDCCKGHLNKALIDHLVFIWNWLDDSLFFFRIQNLCQK